MSLVQPGAANIFVNETVLQRMRRPWQLQIVDCRLPIAKEIRGGIWIDMLMQLFANHADRRGVAAGQALNKFDAVSSVGTDRDRVMRFFTTPRALNSQTRRHVFHQFQSTSHGATECATDPDMRFSGSLLAEHWIKRDYLENVDWLEAELFRNPEDAIVADEPEVFLPQMQERHCRASTVLGSGNAQSPLAFFAPVQREFGCASRLPSLNLNQRSDTRQIALYRSRVLCSQRSEGDACNPACDSGADRIVCLECASIGQRAVLGLHFVVLENDRDRVFALSIHVRRLLHDRRVLSFR